MPRISTQQRLLSAAIACFAIACTQSTIFTPHAGSHGGAGGTFADNNEGDEAAGMPDEREANDDERGDREREEAKPECEQASDCPGADSSCSQRTCENGSCGVVMATAGVSCGERETKFCDGSGQCLPPLELGKACSAQLQCDSGFCVDGVCCEHACGTLCAACHGIDTISSVAGTCSPIEYGADPDGECPDQMVCNGIAGCE